MSTRRLSDDSTPPRRLVGATLALTVAFAFSACSTGTERLDDAGTVDTGPAADATPAADAASADAGPALDVGVDAGSDAGADAGVRRLVERKLFGDMPIQNRVHNPQFDSAIFSWYAFTESGRFITTRTEHRAASPTREPLLRIAPDRRGGEDVVLVGAAKGAPTALDVSLWTGAANPGDAPTVALAGVSPTMGDLVLELSPTNEAPLVLDGITWTRWAGRIDEPTSGWLDVLVTHASTEPVYLTGVWVTPATNERTRGAAEPRAKLRRRTATPLEARARAAVLDEHKKRLGAAPRPQTAPLRPLLVR
jgi:hypothetical protein